MLRIEAHPGLPFSCRDGTGETWAWMVGNYVLFGSNERQMRRDAERCQWTCEARGERGAESKTKLGELCD